MFVGLMSALPVWPQRRVTRGSNAMALKTGKPVAAQLVASECVVTAETKDHQNGEMMSQAGERLPGEEGKAQEGLREGGK